MYNFGQTRTLTLLYKPTLDEGLPMLTAEIIELCKQASIEQDVDRLLHFVSEINRLISLRDEELRKRFAFICKPEPEDQSRIIKSHPRAEAGPDYAPDIGSS
jgi:hypothetical protein